ncbi:MAG: PAS domain S-box protein [Paludibacter sp.]|nr:PAS domain S-box protein [Paludibacter sp.]
MDEKSLNAILNSPILGYAYHRIVLDDKGIPVDYVFLEVNSAFENLTGLKRENILNKSIKETLPGITEEDFDWIGFYGEVALNGLERNFDQYSQPLDKWYRVHVYSPEKNHFTTIFIDISDSKRSEEELRRSEEKYRKLIENSHEVIYQLSPEGIFVFASPAWTYTLGHSIEQVIGHPFTEFVHEEDWPLCYDAINDLLETGNRKTGVEYRVKDVNGKWHWHSSNAVPLLDELGNVLVIDGIAWDVTEKRKSDDLLRKLSLAVEQNPVSVVITDLDANIEYVNKKFSDLTGYLFDELIGRNPRVLKSGEHPRAFYANLWNTLKSGEVWKGEFHNRKKNGDLFWELASISPITNDKGEITHYLGIKEDITERKLSEKQLHKFSKVVEQSPNMILITDLNHVIEYVNPSFSRISGYSQEEIVGRQYKFLKLAMADEPEYEELWTALREGSVWHGENIDKRKNGELYWQEVSINPILDENGNTVNFVAIIQDISSRKKVEEELQELNLSLEQKVMERTSELSITNEFLMKEVVARKKHETELKQARNEAEKANKAKSEFISRMSHELRTPMNSILGFAQLFSMGELSPVQRRGVDHILTSGNHLLKLINEVLDISKIEAGKLSLSVEQIKVKEAISEAIDLVHPLTINPQITIDYIQHVSDDLSVKADKQRVIQVLVNILTNAIKYNKKGGTVTVETFIEPGDLRENDRVNIAITDTGVGIAEKDINKLFVPFERLANTEMQIEGTGLGLSIAKELTALMDGEISVQSKLGEGSTFSITLPHVSHDKPSFTALDGTDVVNSQNKKAKGTVLYIEDNHSNIELVEQVLTTHRPDVKLICNKYGKQTIDLAIEHAPDLILLDLDLPDTHGSEVIKELKQHKQTKHIPVVIISADAMPYRIKSLMKSGAERYLTKPLDVLELLQEIDKYQKK